MTSDTIVSLDDNAIEHIRGLADRIRREHPPSTIGVTLVGWVKIAIKDTETFRDAETIRQAFRQEFQG